MFFETPISRRVGSHRRPEKLRRPLTSLPEKSGNRKPRAATLFRARSTRAARVGAWGIVPTPTSSFGVVRRQQNLWFTWFLCLVPRSTVFGDFCVQQPIVPRISAIFFESLPFEATFWPLSTFLGFLMSESADKKPGSTAEVVPMMSKITKDKLTGPNYLE